MIKKKYSINVKQYNIDFNSKKARITNNITIYKYKNIL